MAQGVIQLQHESRGIFFYVVGSELYEAQRELLQLQQPMNGRA